MRRPSIKEVKALEACRCYVVASTTDPTWRGIRGMSTRVVNEYGDKAVRGVPEGAVVYLPKYPRDWDGHPDAYAALELVVYSRTGDAVVVKALAAGKRMFLFASTLREELVSGKKGELDVQSTLEKRKPEA